MGMITPEVARWLERAAFDRAGGIFMTGTDTGVGKTWIGAHLLKLLKIIGRDVAPRKPVEAGWNADVSETDAWKLAQAGGVDMDIVCRYRLQAPLSPPRAAWLEGKTLSMVDLVAACSHGFRNGQFLYVEGAGGFYSPIAEDGLNADLAELLGLPLVIVTEDRVGCINHVMLTVEAAERRGLKVAGIVLNRRASAPDGMDNLADLREQRDIPILHSNELG
ncbi:MAG: dethiobiotin synthase [Gammaproteobacteria bacterium]|nr:dethiobiotin synthase [Gammaproteobacteria bacterium]MBU1723535.1 dethiobiotin synthase [Gammaproteobacteria bacterium]MBU2004093.1 dethiobiotin synthase [Gammaproteobacteria bacterium]